MNPHRFIVKVQVSLFSTIGPMVLVYNEDHTIEQEFPLTPQTRKYFRETMDDGLPKQYYYAHINEDNGLILTDIAPWQEW